MLQWYIWYCDMADNLEKDLDHFLTEHGVTLPGLLNILGEKNASCMQMSEGNHSLFCELFDEVLKSSRTTKAKGDKLEDLTELLFIRSFPNVFEVVRNCKTSSNEIDFVVSWTSQANNIGLNSEFSGLGNTLLCECKNYGGKVDVTYIGKFASLLSCSDTRIGVMVAWQGVTGKGWSAGNGLIKKIALAEKRYILVITKDDLLTIYQRKTNLFELLKVKFRSLKQDISYDSYIKEHELVDKWA